MPANVLIADPSSEWMRVAVPLVLEQDLTGASDLVPFIANSESGVYQLGATEALRTTLESRANRLSLEATITGASSQRNRRIISLQVPISGFIAGLDTLAKRIDSHATDFSTKNGRALQAFAAGMTAANAQTRIGRLTDAITIDPAFGLAYVVLLETAGGTPGSTVDAIWARAESHASSFTPLDRARFASLRTRLKHAPLSEQASAAAALVKVAPNDADALASLASILFLQGHAADAERSIGRALALNPGNANFERVLALGLIETKQFTQAEKVLSGLDSNGIGSPELAACILLEGNAPRAAAVFENFLKSVANAQIKVALRALWLTLSGKPNDGIALLESTQFTDPRLRSLSSDQIALWQVMEKGHANTEISASPLAKLLAAGAKSAPEWRTKVESLPSALADEKAKQSLLAYGLFLYGFYPEAAEAWQAIDKQSGGTDLRARTMLAASLNHAGQTARARSILVQPFVPDFGDFYAAVSFRELRRLLGQTG